MIPASSKLSRVCGHGHIKKFWLMQTQIETQQFDNEANAGTASWVSEDMNGEGQDISCSSGSNSEEVSDTGEEESGYGNHENEADGSGKEADAAEMLGSWNNREEEEEEEDMATVQDSNVEETVSERMLKKPDSERREESCSSPTSIMEPVCGDDADNSGDEKIAILHHSRPNHDFDENNSTQTSRIVDSPIDDNFAASLKSCTMCGATKTPMWRTGPQGPKSLCNACGIRFKKYRSYPGQTDISESILRPLKRKTNAECLRPGRSHEEISPRFPYTGEKQLKKGTKWHQLLLSRDGDVAKKEENCEDSSPWNIHMESSPLKKIYDYKFQSSLKKLGQLDQHQTVQRVFPEDEEEAAVLLMHLSCGYLLTTYS